MTIRTLFEKTTARPPGLVNVPGKIVSPIAASDPVRLVPAMTLDDPIGVVEPGNGDFRLGASVASISSPTTRVKRYSNEPDIEAAVLESMFSTDALPAMAAPRSSAATAALASMT